MILAGGFKYFLLSPLPGEMIQFDEYFSTGLKPPTRISWIFQLGIVLKTLATSVHLHSGRGSQLKPVCRMGFPTCLEMDFPKH